MTIKGRHRNGHGQPFAAGGKRILSFTTGIEPGLFVTRILEYNIDGRWNAIAACIQFKFETVIADLGLICHNLCRDGHPVTHERIPGPAAAEGLGDLEIFLTGEGHGIWSAGNESCSVPSTE